MKSRLFILACSAFLLFSCQHSLNNKNITKASEGVVSFSVGTDFSRTILPDDTAYKTYSYELIGVKDGQSITLGSWYYYVSMIEGLKEPVQIGAGDWTFILSGKNKNKDIITLTDSVTQTIYLDKNNEVCFELHEPENGYGSLSVEFTYPEGAFNKVMVGLYSMDNVLVSDFPLQSLWMSSYKKDNVPAGDYFIRFFCYQNADDTDWINMKSEYIHVAPGNISSGSIEIASMDLVNTKYKIKYETGIFHLKDNSEIITEYNVYQTVRLPDIEDFQEENIHLSGWYDKCFLDTFTELPVGTCSDYVLFPEISYKVSVSEFKDFLINHEEKLIPVYITDLNPDLTTIFSILELEEMSNKRVALDLRGCLELTEIPQSAFYNLQNLIKIYMPDTVVTIGQEAFRFNRKLEVVVLPNNLTEIPDYCFQACNNLSDTNLYLPAKLNRIGELAFAACGKIQSFDFPEGIKSIGDSAFASAGLTDVKIPDTVTVLGEGVFESCKSLTSAELPSQLTRLGALSFAYCDSLTSVKLPKVTSIGDNCFQECRKLWFPNGLPDTLKTIGVAAFADCTRLSDIVIPKTVDSIGHSAFYNIYDIEYGGSATGAPWGAKNMNLHSFVFH